ncbi:MAG: 4'-phosphopantetheinyl transferase [Pseudomonas sp.]|jgi:4'-phosphopantetheinyl transferase
MSVAEHEVQLWLLSLHEGAARLAELTAEEQARAERFRCPKARNTFIQTRAGLRHVLGHYLALPPLAVALRYGPQGKPQLDVGMPALHFNLSHSHQQAVIAIAQTPIGVDLEWQQAALKWRELAAECCHPSELATLQAASDQQGHVQLLRLWTAKEAYLKARGEGLSLPPTSIRLNQHAEGWQPHIDAPWDDGQNWWLHALQLPEGYLGCVATTLKSPLIVALVEKRDQIFHR